MKTTIIYRLIATALALCCISACSLSYDPAAGGLRLGNDPAAVQAVADAVTARINAELAKKTAPKGVVVPVESGK